MPTVILASWDCISVKPVAEKAAEVAANMAATRRVRAVKRGVIWVMRNFQVGEN
jgi:hypothetical protein